MKLEQCDFFMNVKVTGIMNLSENISKYKSYSSHFIATIKYSYLCHFHVNENRK